MTNPSLSLSMRDREVLIDLMEWQLERLRQTMPWPLDLEQTNLLWWPQDSWDTLQEMIAADCRPRMDSHGQGSVRMAHKEERRNGIIDIHHQQSKLIWSPNFQKSPAPIATSPGYDALVEWFQGAEALDREIHQVKRAWNRLLQHDHATSWLQVHKAFPEVFEILVGAVGPYTTAGGRGYAIAKAVRPVRDKLRIAWRVVQTNNASRAAIMSHVVREALEEARPLATTLCAQAALMKPSRSGLLDDSYFCRTWVR
jgi:hypothetical protein